MATRHTSRGAKRGVAKVPRAVREPQMLDAALRVFAQHGYHGASMAEIAAGAGVTKPMVYAYFGSKDDLYLRCIDHATTRLLATFDVAREADESLDEMLWRRILSYFRFVGERRDEWLVARRQAVASGGPFSERVRRARKLAVQVVVSQLREAIAQAGTPTEESELEPLAEAIVGAGEALADWWMDHPQESAEAMALREMNFVWLGLSGLRSGDRWMPESVH
jgi:AcrR family transcriptional regulator